MEKRSIGKDPIKRVRWQFQTVKTLVPHWTTGELICHVNKRFTAVQTHRMVTEVNESCQIPAWTAAQIENSKRCSTSNVSDQRFNVLFDIVIGSSCPKCRSKSLIVFDRPPTVMINFLGCQRAENLAHGFIGFC